MSIDPSFVDAALLQRICEGDENAFNLLFESWRNRLYSYLLKATKSRETAEEATLDVFLKLWNARQVLPEINNFEAFLFRVVHNKALDYLRKAKADLEIQQDIWDSMEKLASASAADHKILSAETEAAISGAIQKLSPQRQTAFKLSREEWLTYDQIAERMQISRNTVRNHITAALEFIRGHLDKDTQIAGILILLSLIVAEN